MIESALKIEFKEEEYKDSVLKDKISRTHTDEIIIGLCGPIGSNIHFVAKELGAIISEKFNYHFKIIRLSDFIKQLENIDEGAYSSKFEYFDGLITAGNALRSKHGPSVLAELAINEIAVQREIWKNESEKGTFTSQRICYIIDSIKNKEELELFKLIYTDLFYSIGVYSNIQIREENLDRKKLSKVEIYQLMDRDSGEEISFGQKVSETFVDCDFFLRMDQSTAPIINNLLTRYLNLIFNSEIITPSDNETAMYLASAASGNSACLSRQVGASIVNESGEVIAVGWNDVPKAFGGLYKYLDSEPLGRKDYRCINLEGGKCFNDEEKEFIRDALIKDLINGGLLKEEDIESAHNIIKKSRIKELIEFSRAVHAEMHAIIVGSQNTSKGVLGGKLFCTTYPCHNCARHIIAAGIKEVYYIEPYRKSLAIKLHGDSLTERDDESEKVKILMFCGVAPKRYQEFFKMPANSRKKDGQKNKVDKRTVSPKSTLSLQAIPILEKEVIKDLREKRLITLVDE
jgi:deoxycytidylate deaminase